MCYPDWGAAAVNSSVLLINLLPMKPGRCHQSHIPDFRAPGSHYRKCIIFCRCLKACTLIYIIAEKSYNFHDPFHRCIIDSPVTFSSALSLCSSFGFPNKKVLVTTLKTRWIGLHIHQTNRKQLYFLIWVFNISYCFYHNRKLFHTPRTAVNLSCLFMLLLQGKCQWVIDREMHFSRRVWLNECQKNWPNNSSFFAAFLFSCVMDTISSKSVLTSRLLPLAGRFLFSRHSFEMDVFKMFAYMYNSSQSGA